MTIFERGTCGGKFVKGFCPEPYWVDTSHSIEFINYYTSPYGYSLLLEVMNV